MAEKLKSCPFCGAPAELNIYTTKGLVPDADISCTNYRHCGASIGFVCGIHEDGTENSQYIIEAVRRWNKRYKANLRNKRK